MIKILLLWGGVLGEIVGASNIRNKFPILQVKGHLAKDYSNMQTQPSCIEDSYKILWIINFKV